MQNGIVAEREVLFVEEKELLKPSMDIVVEKCSFIAKIVSTNEIRTFNINAIENPKQQKFVGMRVNEEFDIPEAKITYRILDVLPPNEAITKVKFLVNEQERSEVDKLIKKLEQNGFEGFIHTTEIENFKSILECGFLIPRFDLVKKHLSFKDAAEHGVLEKTGDFVKKCCRFYYYYDTPTNYAANYSSPVKIVFDKKLAYHKAAFFAPVNAQQGKITNDVKSALKFDWEGIFERGRYSLSKYCPGELTEGIKRKILLVRNAEFLIADKVSTSFIRKVIVSSQTQFEDLKKFCSDEVMKKVEIRKEEYNRW